MPAEIVQNGTSLLLIGGLAVILFQIIDTAASFVLRQHRLDVVDNLRGRSIHTQVVVLKKVAMTIVGIFTLASMLMYSNRSAGLTRASSPRPDSLVSSSALPPSGALPRC